VEFVVDVVPLEQISSDYVIFPSQYRLKISGSNIFDKNALKPQFYMRLIFSVKFGGSNQGGKDGLGMQQNMTKMTNA
jgi:hypothetical protein